MDNTILIEPGSAGEIVVRLPCSPGRLARIKTIDGRRWHPQERYWTVPGGEGMPARLAALFEGERVEFSPALYAGGVDPPSLPERVRRAARARHFSPSTEKQYAAWIERLSRAIRNRTLVR